VLFSSGTTGTPKGIVHGHGGILLEHLKFVGLQLDVRPGDRFFWYTSTSWMMWNVTVSALLTGATAVLYDGNPTYPDQAQLWRIVADQRVTVFGTSAAYLHGCLKADLSPARDHDLGALRALHSTGSPLSADGFRWAHDRVGAGVPLFSASGGTDVASGFVGGNPLLPVWVGELSGPYLGVDVQAWSDDGRPLTGQVGELVVTAPMPSMPLYFWADEDRARYRASYFDTFPGVWRHGDWIEFTPRGSAVIHGRSDSTLNRMGVRMGTAEIYRAVEALPEVAEALAIGVESPGGGYWLPLFVALRPGHTLDDALRGRITAAIRRDASPRHVPDDVIAVPGIPHTITGKKLEVPVKRLLLGLAAGVDLGAVDKPDLLDLYATFRRGGSDGEQQQQ
jgi:acetoacetyl-CoA synthetase